MHHFANELDEEEEEEDDQEEEEEDERLSYMQNQRHSSAGRDDQQQQFVAYDSMSTILEVDSEEAAESGRQSSAAGEHSRRASPSLGRAGGEDKFSATFNALAAQIERLQRDASASLSQNSSAQESEPKSRELGESRAPARELEEGSKELARRHHQDTERLRARAPSAESLMMINLSPLASPNVGPNAGGSSTSGAPLQQATVGARPMVSHKSTGTRIDLRLMDKLLERYFVERLDKATQSIKFDCELDEELDVGQLRKGGAGARRPQQVATKSVGVGTEKFTRERFSLLPQTKTRSSQTKANWQELGAGLDLGTSETRRFKLSHLSDELSKRRGKATAAAAAARRNSSSELEGIHSGGAERMERTGGSNKSAGLDSSLSSSASRSPSANELSDGEPNGRAELGGERKEEEAQRRVPAKRVTISSPALSSDDSLAPALELEPKRRAPSPLEPLSVQIDDQDQQSGDSLAGQSQAPTDLPDLEADHSRAPPSGRQISDRKWSWKAATSKAKRLTTDGLEREANLGAGSNSKQIEENLTISSSNPDKNQINNNNRLPSLKTELRVVIEFADSKRRQLNELTSHSQLVDGKLLKQTEASRSKQVAVSPRQVYDRLQAAGERHSLMYANGSGSGTGAGAGGPVGGAQAQPALARQWHELSRSSVRNELEADTRKAASGGGGGDDEDEERRQIGRAHV